MEVREFFIPFPGGHIAAKAWGNESGIPVLALHGWKDNLGTFDGLAQLLLPEMYVVGFDYLGHGLSSHKSLGTFYHFTDILTEIKRVVDFLKWTKFNILGHSLGGMLAMLYGSIFPENVCSIICLDILKPPSVGADELSLINKSAIQGLLQMEMKSTKSVSVYDSDEVKKVFMERTVEKITSKAADSLLKRITKPHESGVVFTRDYRIRYLGAIQFFSHDCLETYMSNLKCHLLFIVGDHSRFYTTRNIALSDRFLSIYKENCKSFDLKTVNGNHFVHLNNPENIAPYVTTFFCTHGER